MSSLITVSFFVYVNKTKKYIHHVTGKPEDFPLVENHLILQHADARDSFSTDKTVK